MSVEPSTSASDTVSNPTVAFATAGDPAPSQSGKKRRSGDTGLSGPYWASVASGKRGQKGNGSVNAPFAAATASASVSVSDTASASSTSSAPLPADAAPLKPRVTTAKKEAKSGSIPTKLKSSLSVAAMTTAVATTITSTQLQPPQQQSSMASAAPVVVTPSSAVPLSALHTYKPYAENKWRNLFGCSDKLGPSVDAVQMSDILRLGDNTHCLSYMRLKPSAKKGISHNATNTMVYVVMSGNVSVGVDHRPEFTVGKGDTFGLKPPHVYQLKNLSDVDEAILVLLQYRQG